MSPSLSDRTSSEHPADGGAGNPTAGSANANGAADDEERCPECDASDRWQRGRRHRFSPFGAVLLAVLGFWSAVAGWWLGFGYVPAGALILGAAFVAMATRRVEICEACGFVRPLGR